MVPGSIHRERQQPFGVLRRLEGLPTPMEQLFYFGERSPAETVRTTPLSEIFRD
jgi:hypothetical protein